MTSHWKLNQTRFVSLFILPVTIAELATGVAKKGHQFASIFSYSYRDTEFNHIHEVRGGRHDLTLKVKILLLWKSYYNNKPTELASLDMVLMDEKGSRIFASINKNLISKFEGLLSEGRIMVIAKFGVDMNEGNYKMIDHSSKIIFKKYTSVKASDSFLTDKDGFQFLDFKKDFRGPTKPSAGFDVIGRLISCGDMRVTKYENRESRVLNITLQDERNEVIPCALWDAHALKIQKYIEDNKNAAAPIIILLRLAKCGVFLGEPQVSNCLYGSKVYVNEDIPQIKAFMQRLDFAEKDGSSSSTAIELSTNTIFSNSMDHFTTLEFKYVDDLNDIDKLMSCVVVGRVTGIDHKRGWFYMACRKCTRIVKPKSDKAPMQTMSTLALPAPGDVPPDSQNQLQPTSVLSALEGPKNLSRTLKCEKCVDGFDIYPRMKVHLIVQDGSGEITLSLFEKDVVQIVGKSASYIIAKHQKDPKHELYPEELDVFVNKTYAFIVRITDFNLENPSEVFTVNKLTSDSNVITSLISNSSNHQGLLSGSETVQTQPNVSEDDGDSKETNSVIGDNGTPVEKSNGTATTSGGKRSFIDLDGDPNIQSSSSKTSVFDVKMKIPKVEKD